MLSVVACAEVKIHSNAIELVMFLRNLLFSRIAPIVSDYAYILDHSFFL